MPRYLSADVAGQVWCAVGFGVVVAEFLFGGLDATEASVDVADVALGPSLAAAPDFDEASQPTGMPQTNTTDGKTQLKRYCGAIAL